MIERSAVFLTVCVLAACAHFVFPREKLQMFEEPFAGLHTELANCLVTKLQSYSGWSFRMLQFKHRKYSDAGASEVLAFDTRYMPGIVAAYSPANPDAVIVEEMPRVEILPYAHRNIHSEAAYTAFAILINQIDDTMVKATLQGDHYLGDIAWKMLKTCTGSSHHF